jgi:hypothetical protein
MAVCIDSIPLTPNGQCTLLQLFLMKRGGEEIYVGPLGRHSCELIKYFEVSKEQMNYFIFSPIYGFALN